MSSKEIIQNRIRSLGQSQVQRISPMLQADYVQVDERRDRDYLLLLKEMAEHIRFYDTNAPQGNSNWANFFPFTENDVDDWIANTDQNTTPHVGLLLAFLKMFEAPQAQINALTQRHLNFHYHDILRLQKRSANPDRAHVTVHLKKLATPILVTPDMAMLAGKDEFGRERIYRPVRDVVINHATVTSLRSVFKDDLGILRYAPIADSLDGLGERPKSDDFSWRAFGHDQLPAADVGFAVAAPVLRMAEGTREISLRIRLSNLGDLANENLDQAFKVYLSGAKSWLGPYVVTPVLDGNVITVNVTLDAEQESIVDFDRAVHTGAFASSAPVIQLLLNTDVETPYTVFSGLQLESVELAVTVSGLRSLNASNDLGNVNTAKKFLPFGSEPKRSAKFTITSDEVFSKRLTTLDVHMNWVDVPTNFNTHYTAYPSRLGVINNHYFTADVRFRDGSDWQPVQPSYTLFDEDNAQLGKTISFDRNAANLLYTPTANLIFSLALVNNTWSSFLMRRLMLGSPIKASSSAVAKPALTGGMSVTLNRGFLHSTYRKRYVENVVEFSKSRAQKPQLVVLEEPVTPAIADISLDYSATSGVVNLKHDDLESYIDENAQFFHISYFGQMREHRYVRDQLAFLNSTPVTLLPNVDNAGELLIGLSDLHAGDRVSLLFQVAEGSADPELTGESIQWSVLCDNYWKQLEATDVVLDTTNQLLASGIFQLIIPSEATTTNTILPADSLWLKACISDEVDAVCKLISVVANTIEVEYQIPDGERAAHLNSSLPASSIAKFKDTASSVKAVEQRFASFAGFGDENQAQFSARASERLRHKDRCITPWDFERAVLGEFPNLSKVKCIPHAKPESWAAPGNLMLIVVPDLRNKNAVDPLTPKVDSNTLDRVQDFVGQRVGGQTKVHVRNPRYQAVQVTTKVKFHQGYDCNFYRNQLNLFIQKVLSPWAFEREHAIEFEFAGRLYDSTLLKAVEDLEYVDYVSDFALLTESAGAMIANTQGMVSVDEPDIILVSSTEHLISEVD